MEAYFGITWPPHLTYLHATCSGSNTIFALEDLIKYNSLSFRNLVNFLKASPEAANLYHSSTVTTYLMKHFMLDLHGLSLRLLRTWPSTQSGSTSRNQDTMKKGREAVVEADKTRVGRVNANVAQRLG